MKTWHAVSRRQFLLNTSLAVGGFGLAGLGGFRMHAGTPPSDHGDLLALRRAIIDAPVRVGLHRARVFTEIFRTAASA